MIKKGWMAMPLSERRGPLCRGPDCSTENGPCHLGCSLDARAVVQPVSHRPEHTHSTSGSHSAQGRDRLRRFLGWVLLVVSVLTALSKITDGAHVLIDLISKFL
jgi:hypothetical protein